jgi:hypothetical protein
LPPELVGWKGYKDGRGFIAMPFRNFGEFLRNDDGFGRVDSANLPIGPGTRAVTMLGQYTDAVNAVQRIAIVAGDEAGVAITMERLTGAAPGAWAAIAANAGVVNAVEGDRDAIWDYCVYPFGASTRTGGSGGAIAGPVMILCNADESGPVDSVVVTPSAISAAEYDELQRDNAVIPGGAARIFRATSCESFNGRVHWLATFENATGYPQRHRWSAVGTAFPDEALGLASWIWLSSSAVA